MDELEAWFAALKGAAVGPEKETRVRLEDLGGESLEDEADEVDKVMRWAAIRVQDSAVKMLERMLQRGVNSPSLGRGDCIQTKPLNQI